MKRIFAVEMYFVIIFALEIYCKIIFLIEVHILMIFAIEMLYESKYGSESDSMKEVEKQNYPN